MDCVRTSVRQKAKSVKCLYREIRKYARFCKRSWKCNEEGVGVAD